MHPDLLAVIANVPLLLAAIAGLAMVAWMPRRSRLLAAGGLALVAVHAVLSLLESLVLWQYFYDQIPPMVSDALSWLFYVTLLAGLVLLVLAATSRTPTPTAAGRFSPHPPTPQHPAP